MSWLAENATIVGLLFFFSFFVLMALWTYLPRNKTKIENYGNIPFTEGDDD